MKERGYRDLQIAKLKPEEIPAILQQPVPTQEQDAADFWRMEDEIAATTDKAKKLELIQKNLLARELIKNRNKANPGMPPVRPATQEGGVVREEKGQEGRLQVVPPTVAAGAVAPAAPEKKSVFTLTDAEQERLAAIKARLKAKATERKSGPTDDEELSLLVEAGIIYTKGAVRTFSDWVSQTKLAGEWELFKERAEEIWNKIAETLKLEPAAPQKPKLKEKFAAYVPPTPEQQQASQAKEQKVRDEIVRRGKPEDAPDLTQTEEQQFQFGNWIEKAFNTVKVKMTQLSQENSRFNIDRLLKSWPQLANADIREITAPQIYAWMQAMANRADRQKVGVLEGEPVLNYEQIKKMRRWVTSALTQAELTGTRKNKIEVAEMKSVGLQAPPSLSSQLTMPTREQADGIINRLSGRHRDLGNFMRLTGVRIGEVLQAFNKRKFDVPEFKGLTWGEVQLDKGLLDLRRKRTKNKKLTPPQKVINLSPEAVDFLRELKQRTPNAKATDEIFGDIDDYQVNSFNNAFRQAALAEGIEVPLGKSEEALRSDLFRKMYATDLEGVLTEEEIAAQLGDTVDVVRKWYKLRPSIESRKKKLEARAAAKPKAETPKIQNTDELTPKKDASGRPFYEVNQPLGPELKVMPNFKKGADPVTGVVPGKELAGPFDEAGLAPVFVWERKDGTRWLVTGRHRVDLARREGLGSIRAHVYREKDGFTEPMAAVLDAEQNIRDGQGTIYDYGYFFRNTPAYTEAEARRRGLFRNSEARDAFTIARNAADATFDEWYGTDGRNISDKQALAIATAAPNNEAAQTKGIALARKGKSPTEIRNLVVRASNETPQLIEGDMFGATEFVEMDKEEAAAEAMRKELTRRIAVLSSPNRNRATASEEGVDVKLTQEQADKRLIELRAERAALEEEWWLDAALARKVRERAGTLPEQVKKKDASPTRNLSLGGQEAKRYTKLRNKQEAGTLTREESAELERLSAVGIVGELFDPQTITRETPKPVEEKPKPKPSAQTTFDFFTNASIKIYQDPETKGRFILTVGDETPAGVRIQELQADTKEDIIALLSRKDINMNEDSRRILKNLVTSKAWDKLPGFKLAITNWMKMRIAGVDVDYMGEMSFDNNWESLMRLSNRADAAVTAEEILHHIYNWMSTEDRQWIIDARNEAVIEALREAYNDRNIADANGARTAAAEADRRISALRQLKLGPLTSDQFMNRQLPRELYHLANGTEYWAWLMNERAVKELNRVPDASMMARFKELLRDIYQMFRRAFKLTTRDEDIWQQMISGKYEYFGPDNPYSNRSMAYPQVFGQPLGEERESESIEDTQAKFRADPDWNFTGDINEQTTERAARLLEALTTDEGAQRELGNLAAIAPERMAGALVISDIWNYGLRLIRDNNNPALYRYMIANSRNIASRYGAVSGSEAGSILRGLLEGSKGVLWENAVEIFQAQEKQALTKIFGAERADEIIRILREELRDPQITPEQVRVIIEDKLTQEGETADIKFALRLLDEFERRQTEWFKPDKVLSKMKRVVQEAFRASLSGKTVNEIRGGAQAWQQALARQLMDAALESVEAANELIRQQNEKIDAENETLAEAQEDGEEVTLKDRIPEIEIDEEALQRKMDELAVNIWNVRLEKEWTKAQAAREREANYEENKAKAFLDNWAKEGVEWLKPERKSKVQEIIKNYLKSGGLDQNGLRDKLIEAGVGKKTAGELAYQAVQRRQSQEASRRILFTEREAKRIAGLANKTAKDLLDSFQEEQTEWKPEGSVLNAVREIIRKALKIKPTQKDIDAYGEMEASKMIDPISDAWSAKLVEDLKAAGVTEGNLATELAQAVAVKRRAQWASARTRIMQRAAKSNRLSGLMEEILDAPYLLQQDPKWRAEVASRWFMANGLSREQADEAVKLFQKEFQTALDKAAEELAKRLKNRIKPGAETVEEFIRAFRAGLADPSKPWAEEYAAKAGWRLPTPEQLRRLAELDLKLSDERLELIERKEITQEMMGIYLHMRMPPSVMTQIAANFIATNLTGIRTLTVNTGGPFFWMLMDRILQTMTSPMHIGEIWKPIKEAYRNFLEEVKYSMSTDAYTVINNDFQPASNELRRQFESGMEDIKSKSLLTKANGLRKIIFGSQQYFMRLLNSLDQANAMAVQEAQLALYGAAAFREAGLSTADVNRLVEAMHDLKQIGYLTALSWGYSENRARVHANSFALRGIRSIIAERITNRGVVPTIENAESLENIPPSFEASRLADAAMKAAENDAYSIVGRLAPGVQEREEGGLISRLGVHSLLDFSSKMRRGHPQDRMLAVALLGYLNVPIRTARFYAWNSPYGLIRLAVHSYRKSRGLENWWKQSLATKAQEQYRLKQAMAATAVQAVLTATGFAMFGLSSDDDEDKRKNGIYITGEGPKNRNLNDAWQKVGFRKNSIVLFYNGNAVTLPLTRLGEPFSHMFWLLAARDDYNWRKKEAKTAGREFKETWTATTGRAMGNYLALLGQRGIVQNLTRWGRAFGSEGGAEAALASVAGGTVASATMPFLGMQRSIRDMAMGRVDTSSIQSALIANFPVLGAAQTPAINRYGDKLGNTTWYGKIADTGVPIAFQVADTSENRKFYEMMVGKGIAPPMMRRAVVEEKYGVLTDEDYGKFVAKSGATLKQAVLADFKTISEAEPEAAKRLISKLAAGADRVAAQSLGFEPIKIAATRSGGGGLSFPSSSGSLLAAPSQPASLISGTATKRTLPRGRMISSAPATRTRYVTGRLRSLRPRRLGIRNPRRRLTRGFRRISTRMRRPRMRIRRLSLA